MKTLVQFILGMLVCAGLAPAETLERVISREDPKFDSAAAGMSVGRDGNVYLCCNAAVGRGAYVLRVSRDGTQKAGGDVVWDGLNTTPAVNANGVMATGNGHFQHHVHIYDANFRHVAECGDFAAPNFAGGPLHVEAGASGDFYGLHPDRKRILRISPAGAIVKSYSIHPDAKAQDFRVCEATETFVVRGQDGALRGVSFAGDIKWAKKLPGLFDVAPGGRVLVLDGSTLKSLEPDELNPGEVVESRQTVELPPEQLAGVNALAVFGDELIVKRALATELFQVYDLATGKQKRVVRTEHERMTAEFANGPWTAGQSVAFKVQSSNAAAQWRVWATAFGDDNWCELKRTGDQVAVPADFAGMYQLRVAPTLNAPADCEFTLRSMVEVRIPNSQGTVSVWTPLNRLWWGRGEAIPASVVARPAKAGGAATVTLAPVAPGDPKPVWSTNLVLTANAATTFTIPAAFTAQLAAGRYELRATAPGFTCVGQPIRLGPGLAARSPFRTTCYGDYGNFNSTADAWAFADVASDMLNQAQALGINQYINRTVFYRYPTSFADTPDAGGLLRRLEQRLGADLVGVAPQKVAFGFPQAHVLGAYSAFGLREWLLPVVMDGSLPLNAGWNGKGTPPAEGYAGTIRGIAPVLTSFPAFAGWDWAANWWAAGDRFAAAPAPAKSVEKPPVLEDAEPGAKDAKLELDDPRPGKGAPPAPATAAPPTEQQRYAAALKKANDTGAWDPVLDTVGDRAINWQPEAQQGFKAALDQVAPQLTTASSGPYRRPEVYPPVSFANVDEVDLHYQAEQYTTPNWTAHATDYYKRPGKPAWIHPEFLMNETGTGEHILPFTWMAVMRGVDGIGISGNVPGGMRSVFRALDEFARQYGPWLTTLENHDRIAIVVSHRQVKLDPFSGFSGPYFTRLWEAFQSCLYARQPATFLYTEDLKPDTLRRFKALLVVGQQYEPEPPLAELLAQAKLQGLTIFADGTCRASLVKGYTPLGLAFDHIEKLNGFNNENAFTEFPEVLLANAPLVATKLGTVVPPVAVVDQPEVLVSERCQGDARFVWVVNNTRMPLDPGLLRRVGTAIATRQPVVAKVTLPVATGEVVVDVFAGKEVTGVRAQGSGEAETKNAQRSTPNAQLSTKTDARLNPELRALSILSFDADLRYSQARLYAVLPGAIRTLELQAPQELKPGQTFTWTATVPGIKAALPLRVELRDSKGVLLDERFTTTGSGTLTVPLTAAMPVSFAATELVSGKSSGVGVQVAGVSQAPPPDIPRTNTLNQPFTIHDSPFTARRFGPRLRDLAVSQDGGTALISASDWNQNLYVLDLATGKVRWTGNVGDHFASAPAATPDGFAVRGYDLRTAECYHLYRLDAAGRVTRRFAIPGIPSRWGGVNEAAIAPSGDWLAGAGNLALGVWAADGKLLWSQDWSATTRAAPRLLALGNDSLVLAKGQTLTAFEARTGKPLWNATPAPDGEIQGLDAGADGRTVLVRTNTRSGRVFVLRDGKTVGILPTGADAAVAAPDGSWIIVTTGRQLKRYTAAGELQWVFSADDTLRSPRLSPDGKRLAAGSELGTLYVFDVATGGVRNCDLGALPVPAWTPTGELVVATWMGTVCRFDAELQEKWRANLAAPPSALHLPPSTDNRPPTTDHPFPTTRLTSWSNAEATSLPLTPNLLGANTVVRALNGGGGMGLENPTALLFDGKSDAPPKPWLSWGAVVSIDFWHGPFTLEFDASPARLRVTAITLAEDAAHPESWLRDAKLEYWDETQKTWLGAQYLTADAAIHSHKLIKPIEASKFRLARPDGPGWPVGSLRLAEVVFLGEALGVAEKPRSPATPDRAGTTVQPTPKPKVTEKDPLELLEQ